MWAAGIVEADVASDRGAGLGHAGIGPQVDFFVFDGPPQTLDEDVVAPRSFSVHADLDFSACQNFDEVGGRELAALIGVEDVGLAVARQCILNSFNAEVGLQRDRDPPGQHAAGEPVQHGGEIDDAARHRDEEDQKTVQWTVFPTQG